MPRGRPDEHRRLADRDSPEAMPQDHALGAEPATGRSLEVPERSEGERAVGLVVERPHSTPGGAVRPDPPGEQYDPAEAGTFKGAHRGGGGEGTGGQPDAHGHPPPYGGWIANSSPGRTRVARLATYAPLSAKRHVGRIGSSFG